MSPAKPEIEVESRMYRLSALGNSETWIDFFRTGRKGAYYPDEICTLLYFCTFKSTKPGT